MQGVTAYRTRATYLSLVTSRALRILLMTAMLAVPSRGVHAQTSLNIHVRVQTAPVADALVTVFLVSDSSIHRSAETDSAGRAVFGNVPPSRYRIRVEKLGYATASREVRANSGSATRVEIELRESAFDVEGLTIEADRHRARFQETAGATVSEITQRQLKMLPAFGEADVLRAIEVLPGVVSTSDFSSAFNVRGGSADENLILLDGLPIYNPFHLGGLFSVFNADMVKRAELLSGGFGAQYGGRVSSVLTVESEVSAPDSAHRGVDVQGGVSLLATRLALGADIPHRVLSLAGLSTGRVRVSGRRSYFDQLLKPIFNFPYHLTDAQLYAEASTAHGARVTISGYAGNDVLDLAGLDSFPLQLRWHWGNDVIGGSWTLPLGGGRVLETHAGYTQFQTNITFPQFDDTEFSSRIHQALLRSEVSGHWHQSGWRVGVAADRMTYHNLFQTGGTVFGENDDRGTLLGAFAQQSLRTGAWLVETGMRVDSWKARSAPASTVAEPRIAVKRFLGVSENFALKLAAGRYAQFAHSLRDEELPLGIDVWVLSGDRAPVVVSNQLQGGIEGFLPRRWYFAVESYYRRFNGVVANNMAEDPNNPYDDLLRGTGLSYGADMQVRRDDGNIRPMLAISWLKATRTFDDIGVDPQNPPKLEYPPIFDRRVDVDLVVETTLPRRWLLGVRWNFGTGLPFTRPIGGYTVYEYSLQKSHFHRTDSPDSTGAVLLGPRNGERYPVYHRLDAGIHRTFVKRWGTLTPSLDVLNVYNRRNVLFYFFQYDRTPATRSGISMFPLLPTVGMEFRF